MVPKKSSKLKSAPLVPPKPVENIVLPHLIARDEDSQTTQPHSDAPRITNSSQPKSLADFMNELNINSQFALPKRSVHEPRVFKFEDVMSKPSRPRPAKTPPKPPSKPRSLQKASTEPLSIMSYPKGSMVPLPGMAKLPLNNHNARQSLHYLPSTKFHDDDHVTQCAQHSMSLPANLPKREPVKLRHLNKGRSRGPKRRSQPQTMAKSRPSPKPKPSHLRGHEKPDLGILGNR